MTPKHLYQIDLSRNHFLSDPDQEKTVSQLQVLYDDLMQPRSAAGFFDRLRGRALQPYAGLYLWGGVGSGKTHLMDRFYDSVPICDKQRFHFNAFMQYIHKEIGKLSSVPNPLEIISGRLADDIKLLCLDEFHVNDIGDAMLLSGLLEGLFSNGVALVMTSNVVPDELYKNGLQRERFLPAIELIKQYTSTVSLNSGIDYRRRGVESAAEDRHVYPVMADTDAHAYILQRYMTLTDLNSPGQAEKLSINNRDIQIMARNGRVLWAGFYELCATHRSSGDYLEIAENFDTLFITHIPVMKEAADAAAQRFIHLIDALYDNNICLITTIAALPDKLYRGRRMRFSFKRAASRLYDMAGSGAKSKLL